MKKTLALVFTLILTLCLIPMSAIAAEQPAEKIDVTVTIVNETPVVAAAKISVSDADKDGVITISDALYWAHERKFQGGAKEGYATAMTAWGLSPTKLWGVSNGGSYSYYVNNVPCTTSLSAEIKAGDYICAFVITDTVGWSDTYSYFDRTSATITAGEELTLTLSYHGMFDTEPKFAEGATITVDGKTTELQVDKDGKVTVLLTGSGTHIISATSTMNLVPPVCIVTVNPPETTFSPTALGWLVPVCAAVVIAALAVAIVLSKKNSEKK